VQRELKYVTIMIGPCH